MAWTELTRAEHSRRTTRYPSDLTDSEWEIVRPLLPGRNRLGRPRQVELRRVWNAIQYVAASGLAIDASDRLDRENGFQAGPAIQGYSAFSEKWFRLSRPNARYNKSL